MSTLIGEATSEVANEATETQNQDGTTLIGEASSETVNQTENQSSEVSQETTQEIEFQEFTLPEGYAIDESVKNDFIATAKELKLSQEQAQKLIDMQIKSVENSSAKVNDDFKKIVNDWQQETIQDLGANYKTELTYVAKAIDRLGTPELRNILNQTGLGNNKEVVKFFINVGKKISDDSFISGKSTTGEEKSLADRIYG